MLFELPNYVQEILARKHDITEDFEYALIRGWIIRKSWKAISRINPKKRIRYTLLSFDEVDRILRVVTNSSGQKIKWILWNTPEYVTSEWKLYTAKKYLPTSVDSEKQNSTIISIELLRVLNSMYKYLIWVRNIRWNTTMIQRIILANTDIWAIQWILLDSNQSDWERHPLHYLAYLEIIEEWYEQKSWSPLGFKWLEEPLWYEEYLWF